MFEINMDEYLDDEVENLRLSFDVICRQWDKKVSLQVYAYLISAYHLSLLIL
jgi:recyclin-1